MHPEVKRMLEAFGQIGMGDVYVNETGKHYISSINMENTDASRTIAFHTYEALREGGMLKGAKQLFSNEMINGPLPVKFNDQAALATSEIFPGRIVFFIDFGERQPLEIKNAIDKIIEEEEKKAAAPSAYEDVIPAMKSLAKAARLSGDTVIRAVGDEILVHLKCNVNSYSYVISDLSRALKSSGLTTDEDMKSIPLATVLEDNTVLVSYKMVKSPQEVKEALFEAEQDIRHYNITRKDAFDLGVPRHTFVQGLEAEKNKKSPKELN